MTDLTELSTDELRRLFRDVQAEMNARRTLEEAPGLAQEVEARLVRERDDVARGYLRARDRGVASGEAPPWVQPTGAHDAYPLNFVVAHAGTVWVSLIPANTTEPGDDGDPQAYRWWKDISTPAPGPGDDNWEPGQVYEVGDSVIWAADVYDCIQAHTAQAGQEPPNTPALWELWVDPDGDGPGPVDWLAGVNYVVGNLVVFEGVTYRALQDHASISVHTPPLVPALWEVVSGA